MQIGPFLAALLVIDPGDGSIVVPLPEANP